MNNEKQSKKIHLAFDMDGVIYSTENFIAEAYETAIKNSNLGFDFPNTDEILQQVGKPVKEIFEGLFGDLTKEQTDILLKETRLSICQMIEEDEGFIFEGIPEIIRKLSELYELNICSNAGMQYVETILAHYGLKQYFNPVLTLETTGTKNKSELLETYIHNSEGDAGDWIMIGDRKTDLEAAEYNRCSFIGCYWGHGNMEELEGSNVIIEEPESLINAIKKVSTRNL